DNGRGCASARSASSLAQVLALALTRLDPDRSAELPVNPPDAFDLPLGGEALVEALAAKTLGYVAPGRELLLPAPYASFDRLLIHVRQVVADAEHRFGRDPARHHVLRVAPCTTPYLFCGLEEVAHDPVNALHLALGAASTDAAPVRRRPAVDLVE